MRIERARLQLGMELDADEPGMVGVFDDLGQEAVGRHAGEAQALRLEPVAIADVDLVAVAVALGDLRVAVDLGDLGCRARASPGRRRAAWCRRDRRPAARFSSSLPRSHSVMRPTTGSGVGPNSVELALGDAGEVARRLDHRHLHAEADAEIGHLALAGEARRPDLALGAALAEAAGHQDAVHPLQDTAPGPRSRRSRSRSSRA